MNNQFSLSVSSRRSLFIWALFCVIAGATFLAYTLTSLANGHGEFVMPLDDVYIHFQYARQMTMGQPYVYNPGLPATSGATSFLYPYILAVGYLIGFQGLKLGLWAMIVGALALVSAMWFVYKLVRLLGTGEWLAVLVAVAFGVDGAIAWHFMSGMETGLAMLLTLGTLYAVIKVVTDENESLTYLILWATGLALIRPEGGVLAVVAMGVVWWGRRGLTPPPNPLPKASGRGNQGKGIGLIIPVLAVGVQPLVNWLLTGSAVASGNAAKSILGMVPFYWDEVIRRIIGNFAQIWVEFGTGISLREGLYIMPLLLLFAAVGIGFLLIQPKLRLLSAMLVLWLVSGTAMLATLDTVFWHFKRYQMPFMGLLFPLAGWGIAVVTSYKRQVTREKGINHRDTERRSLGYVIVGVMLLVAALTSVQFLRYYGLNVGYVYAQPLQMARWLQANTPDNAVIAVHDVGMMRYMGGRTTLDIVGLTTKGAADYWRNGPGAVAEFLMLEKPDYIASYGYGHGYGLGMIADTDIYGKPLASFPVELDNNANVALAANFQGIYKPVWKLLLEGKNNVLQPSIVNYLEKFPYYKGLADQLDVADIDDERYLHYQWKNSPEFVGFETDILEMNYAACNLESCRITDGARRIDGEESFEFSAITDSGYDADAILVTRVHPISALNIDVFASSLGHETHVATRWIPAIPGEWLEIPTLIPKEDISAGESLKIRIVVHSTDGVYVPAYHWLYYGSYVEDQLQQSSISTFQNGAIQLGSAKLDYQPDKAKLGVKFEWYTDGSAKGDYKVFVHLYGDKSKPPVAQLDMRPGNGTLPPGNWLPGVLRDTITVDLNGVAAGTYQVAIGMYDPVTFERLQPTGGDEQGRLFIGEVEIKG